jgi:uncharacterized pyridoxal phosphate-containing UPF0001 family protein
MIKDNIARVQERILRACARSGCNPASVKLVCVSKGRSFLEVKEAIAGGIFDIGESKIQEALLTLFSLLIFLSALFLLMMFYT